MQTHTVRLQENEFKLVQALRRISGQSVAQETVIQVLLQGLEQLGSTQLSNPACKWLQVVDPKCFRLVRPVKPKAGSPLASDIILAHRNRLAGNRE